MWFYKYAAPTALPAPDSGSTLREAPAARQENNSTEANEGNEDEFSLRFLCCLLLKRNPCHPYHCKKKSRNSNKNSAAKERKELRDKHLRCSSLCDLCDLLWPIQFWLRLCRSGKSVVQVLWFSRKNAQNAQKGKSAVAPFAPFRGQSAIRPVRRSFPAHRSFSEGGSEGGNPPPLAKATDGRQSEIRNPKSAIE